VSDDATALRNAMALHRAGDLAAAEREYRAILARDPANPDALHLLGLIAYRRSDFAGADRLVSRALDLARDNPVFLANLGNVRKDAGDAAGAIACYRRAIAIDPAQSGARNNLGVVLLSQGALEEAIACFRSTLAHAPGHARAWHNLGNALALRGDHADAAEAQRKAVALQPDLAEAWTGLGLALGALGEHDAAVRALRSRMDAAPVTGPAHADLALALHRAGELVDARAHYERSLAADPAALPVRCNLLALLQRLCDWPGVDTHWRAVEAAIEQGRAGVPGGLLIAQPGATPALQLAAARANAAAQPSPPASRRRIARNARTRIGYLSADFREHATAYLTTEVFELHDRARHEIVLLSYGPDDASDARARLVRAADRFVDLRALDDAGAAARIAELGLDLLVDLNGNTDNGRMGIPARRPAPIQLSWLGFPGTLGVDFYDGLVADPHVIPEGEERWYSERVIRLPDCYQCNDRRRPRPESSASRAAHGLPQDAFVLCCFNQSFKITRTTFDLWLRVLRARPRAMLWLLEDNPTATAVLQESARAAGVAPERLAFAPHRPLAEHLERYRIADLAVDTIPCTSHTTASDALWLGCPLVTLTGDTFAARVATSLVRNAGLPELALPDLDACERAIVGLIDSPRELAARRAVLAGAPLASPLFDTPRFVRNLEQVFARLTGEGGP